SWASDSAMLVLRNLYACRWLVRFYLPKTPCVCKTFRAIRFGLGAGDEIRTHDNHVGNVVLYQLSYARSLLAGRRCKMIPAPQLAVAEWHKSHGIIGPLGVVARAIGTSC